MNTQDVSTIFGYPLQIGLLMLVGFFGVKVGFLRADALDMLSSYAVKIALPCMLIHKVPEVSGKEALLSTVPIVIIALFLYILMFLIGHWSGRLFGYTGDRLNAHTVEMGIGNMAIIGFQLLLTLLGEEVGVYFAAFFLIDQIFLYAVAYPMTFPQSAGRIKIAAFLKKLASPGMIALLIAIAMIAADIRLPEDTALTRTIISISNSCQSVSLIFVGATLSQLKIEKGAGLLGCFGVIVIRMLVMPFIVFGVLSLFPLPLLARQTAALVTALPSAIAMSVMQKTNGSDYKYGSLCTCITTIAFVGTLPVVSLLLQRLS